MEKDWKIYTKTGDKGQTSLLGGTRVPKNHVKIEVYGTLDELNSFIGIIRDHSDIDDVNNDLIRIQQHIFIAEALIAADSAKSAQKLDRITENDIEFLEKRIDGMNKNLPELQNFILPGGHPLNSFSHTARCICRRAERMTIGLTGEENTNHLIIKYLNRLSDYLFVVARYFSHIKRVPENTWKTDK